MLAHGFRNAPRLAIRPGTNDVWVADCGGGYWEEINRVPDPTDPVRNFGWPCYEGGLDANGVPYPRIRPRSDDQELDICEDLYAEGNATTAPYWAYDHERRSSPARTARINPRRRRAGRQRSGASRSTRPPGSFPAAYRRRAVLRRRAARLHLGDAARRRTGSPSAAGWSRSHRTPPARSTSRSRRAATCCGSTTPRTT